MSDFLLEVRDLACERDHRLLFAGLSFGLSAGEVLQVAGANGAGKTTLLRLLCGISSAHSGDIFWRSSDIRAVRAQFRGECLYLGHAPGVTLALTALENLRWYCRLNQRVSDDLLWQALASVGLAGYEEVPAFRLSAGQQRRIALARLVLSNAALWILDEPFTAIDRHGVADLERLICRFVGSGGAVVLTTHHALNLDTPFRRVELGVAG